MAELFSDISKPVISRADSTICGVVKDVYFDAFCRKIVYFVIGDRPYSSTDALRLLPYECVKDCKDAVMIEDNARICSMTSPPDGCVNTIIGKPVYTLSGHFKGNVVNVRYIGGGKVSRLFTDMTEFVPSSIAGVGDAILLKSLPKSASATRIPRPFREGKAEILRDDATEDREIAQTSESVEELSFPADKTATYSHERLKMTDSGAENDDEAYAQDAGTAIDGNAADTVIGVGVADTAPLVKISTAKRDSNGKDADQSAAVSADVHRYSLLPTEAGVTASPAVRVLPAIALNSGEPAFTQDALNMLLDGSIPAATEADAHTPTRIICDYDFLLGRTLGADLNAYNGRPIAPKGSEVTPAIVEMARHAGKLVELTLNSIKK